MEKDAHFEESVTGLLNKSLRLLAYAVSALAGLWTAKVNIGDSVYQRLKIDGGFDDLRTPFMEKRHELTQSVLQATSDVPNLTKSFAADSIKMDKAYFPKIEQRLRQLGLGTLDKQWAFIHRGQKQEAIINGLTVTGISIGALLSIANSKTATHFLAKKESEKDSTHSI